MLYLNIIFFFLKVDQLWSKLANLRSYYTKELKKVNDSKKSGAGTDEVYKSSWSHFESLHCFLRTQVVPRKSQTNLVSVLVIIQHSTATEPVR